ncbi:fumarylacetoacetate hydrolase family protein [Natrialba sp. INN-245]|uniref:fumarylacetoacetate hydrolase family protein n=1 Tax=Natrialba sp. INN-245 TaxID=2690967 RepID=UPI00131379EE|nr:fumarylacetoacetate hydrolase family protein [Natrialba sp. INN-245]MWV41981.1 fumarylacetoacetate hydrolase [Natrialba sp. INN-245]
MRYYQRSVDGNTHLVGERDGTYSDLSTANPRLQTFADLLYASNVAETEIDTIGRRLIDEAEPIPSEDVGGESLIEPVTPQEVWAAGVTYRISEEAREAESSKPEFYLEVYDSDRPELFFKATPERIVGPNDRVGIRGDSDWNVPEPELGVVLSGREIVGYTIGNDMSSRAIEGENPLYLPQSKVYDRSCAIGPAVRSAASIDDPADLEIWMRIERDGDVLYDESTNTNRMVRSIDELVDWYLRHNAVPDVSVLLTGTSLVPDDEFTLEPADRIEIGIEGIGTLSNTVTEV